jgi:hypothetical protein
MLLYLCKTTTELTKLSMKRISAGFLFLFLMAVLSPANLYSQNKSTTSGEQQYPASFLISKAELQGLQALKVHTVIDNKGNRFLDGSIVVANTRNGDMQYIKIKSAFFRKGYLNIQVNGKDSTQVFVTSDDKSVFYKGRVEKENWVLIKCSEDEIVSE